MPLQEIAKTLSQFHGIDIQFSHTHAELYRLAKQATGKYAEIGSHIGNSAAVVAAANEDIEIFCFDAPNNGWGGDGEALPRLKKTLNWFFPKRSHLVTGDSHDKRVISEIERNGPYDLFLVDGDHSVLGAYADLVVAYNNLKEGGIIVFDDLILHPELEIVFNDFVEDVALTDFYKIMELSEEDKAANLLLRGVGVLIK